MTSSFSARSGVPQGAGILVLLLLACLAFSSALPSPAQAEGMFVAECQYSHRAHHDPIVAHGRPGASHAHEFFGNRSTNASSTTRSLRRASGRCKPGGDESAYWVPALYRGGKVVRPKHAQIYYQDFGRFGRVQPLPTGLRMIAGSASARKAAPNHIVKWECANDHGVGFPTIPSCTKAQGPVTLRITFPDCWDGRRLDSPNHRSHMAYNRADGFEPLLQRCPRSHPVVVPQVQLNVFYPMHDGKGVKLATGSIVTAHADLFNAWRPSLMRQKVDTVLNAGQACHPYFGCMDLPGNDDEPVTAKPRKHLVDRFYAPRGGGGRHHGHRR